MAQLAREGYDPAFGARPLKRVIQREIADPASVMILDGSVGDGGTIEVRAGVEEGAADDARAGQRPSSPCRVGGDS